MVNTLEDKIKLINKELENNKSKNPIEIAQSIMDRDFINIHGPEHHYLDGASFLIAYQNAGGNIDLNHALEELQKRAMNMPGAMCGLWGVCGSVASVGACLAIINGTGPLSDNEFYKDNMEYTSSVISRMSQIGGPRCCKRNAFISLLTGAEFVKRKYGVIMDIPLDNKCKYSFKNAQCIKDRCPFYKGVKKSND
ncbi:MAG: DUF5714 domain-containing protein [Bacilli bacterium]